MKTKVGETVRNHVDANILKETYINHVPAG